MPELSADLYGTVSHKLDALQPSGIREFNKEVSKIPGIIKLTLGEPDMATPEHVKQAAIRSIEEDDSHYAPQMGKPELLEAISDYIQNTRDVRLWEQPKPSMQLYLQSLILETKLWFRPRFSLYISH